MIAADVHGVKNPVADVAVFADRLLDGGALFRRQVDLGFDHPSYEKKTNRGNRFWPEPAITGREPGDPHAQNGICS
jgi:hypothetical protein